MSTGKEMAQQRAARGRGIHDPRYFALASKGHVEIVRASQQPSLERSLLKRSYTNWLGGVTTRRIPIYSFGGNYQKVKHFTTRQFSNFSGHTLRPGTIWELESEMVKKMEAK